MLPARGLVRPADSPGDVHTIRGTADLKAIQPLDLVSQVELQFGHQRLPEVDLLARGGQPKERDLRTRGPRVGRRRARLEHAEGDWLGDHPLAADRHGESRHGQPPPTRVGLTR